MQQQQHSEAVRKRQTHLQNCSSCRQAMPPRAGQPGRSGRLQPGDGPGPFCLASKSRPGLSRPEKKKKKESSTIRFLHLQARQDGGSGTDATEIRPGRKSETRPYRRLSRAQLCAGPDPRDVTGLTGSLSRKAPLQRIMKLLILETLLLSNGELCYVNYRPLNAPNEVPDDHY